MRVDSRLGTPFGRIGGPPQLCAMLLSALRRQPSWIEGGLGRYLDRPDQDPQQDWELGIIESGPAALYRGYQQYFGRFEPDVGAGAFAADLTRQRGGLADWIGNLADLGGGLPGSALVQQTLRRELRAFNSVAVYEPAAFKSAGDVEISGGFWRYRDTEPRPLVVIPSAWGAPWVLFTLLAFRLALQGYNVLAYNPRGFFTSGGTLDVGGPLDWADGSAAIDHATARAGEPTAVGFLGDSYGSGISMMVAAHDVRVTAVVALSAWGNLEDCLYGNDTRHMAAFRALIGATRQPDGTIVGRFDEDTQELLDNFLVNVNLEKVREWARERSPVTYVDELNKRKVPILVGSHWHETLFPVNQLLDLFEKLTGPKRLVMSIGDHSAGEQLGLAGLPNRVVDNSYAWLAAHLQGEGETAAFPQVSNQVMFTYATLPPLNPETGLWDDVLDKVAQRRADDESATWALPIRRLIVRPADVEERATWAEVSTSVSTLYLRPPEEPPQLAPRAGELSPDPGAAWSRTFNAGNPGRGLTAAAKVIFTGTDEVYGSPAVYRTRLFNRMGGQGNLNLQDFAAVWRSAALTEQLQIRGKARLHLTFAASAVSATLIAYLFDVDPILGFGRIITHEPTSFLDLQPGAEQSLDLELQATAYNVPAGHRLMLVIGTKDQLYAEASLRSTRNTFSSGGGTGGARLELPVGG